MPPILMIFPKVSAELSHNEAGQSGQRESEREFAILHDLILLPLTKKNGFWISPEAVSSFQG
jgi:hypothetical protein